jgi:hypothetical protein
MQILDNVNKTVKVDLATTVSKGDKISIAAACFSIYAYQALKKQLDGIDEMRFVFTSPTFLHEKAPKEKREFYIPQLNRERSLYGTEFEVKLRNELTQKAIARECTEWIKKKVQFRSNVTGGVIGSFLNVVKQNETIAYAPLNSFTTSDLGCERGNNIMNLVNRIEAPLACEYVKMFEQIWNDKNLLQDVTEQVIDGITAAYNENSPEFVYFVAIYNIFNEFLSDISEDVLPNEATGFKETKIWNKLYNFQKDATLAIINKLEKFNGCILADSVGLGKTFTALAVIKYYELRNRNVLVLCPKKLGDNWLTFKENYLNNPIATDRLRYDVLYHTDLSREHGFSGSIDLSKLNWSNYDLVVIDESHNFRNNEFMNQNATTELNNLFTEAIFSYPKPTSFLYELIRCSAFSDSAIILDFFSGSATTAHAVMQLNLEDGGKRKFIMVQLPEICHTDGEAAKSGYKNICEIGKERIRRAGKKIKEDNKDKEGIENLDTGFRVFKLDSSNMKDVYYTPEEYTQMNFALVNFEQVFNTYSPKTIRRVL